MSASPVQPKTMKVCSMWPLGQCKFGNNCKLLHPANLDPALFDQREHQEYQVPNNQGEGCVRCLQTAKQCDKPGRSPSEDDPCSECRWFRGDKGECTISDSSYNDRLWCAMLARGEQNYTLPAYKASNLGKPDKMPAPMPANQVRADWRGETRDELLAKADMLPAFVRDLPRAYLVPPRPSKKLEKSRSWLETHPSGLKRKRDSEDDVAPNTSANLFPAPVSFPAINPTYGKLLSCTWTVASSTWELVYTSGIKLTSPPFADTSALTSATATELKISQNKTSQDITRFHPRSVHDNSTAYTIIPGQGTDQQRTHQPLGPDPAKRAEEVLGRNGVPNIQEMELHAGSDGVKIS